MNRDPLEIIEIFFTPETRAYDVLIAHSESVMQRALQAAATVSGENPDLEFIRRAAMLHDIGMIQTDAPEIGCHGAEPYMKHGILGREMLEDVGLHREALVCERHTGMGLTVHDIEAANLPLPLRDMCPQSLEEMIICYADNFFSKSAKDLRAARSADEVAQRLARFGEDKVRLFREWDARFGVAGR
ncbi:MAG: HDIG domain-containing protein [Verrucomicrobia bacterium]|nr:HDIG domain-containing protein [Verrucomicrobiota bacterium]MDA1087969.1 HDIG domain-containing protein [Verrucomicrobiota bacterium]